MKVNPKKVSRKITLLTNPTPQYMSLVGAGANMMPWNSIKADKVDTAAVPELAAKANAPTAFTKFAFDKATFPDVAEVTAWLTSGGYEGFEIASTDTGFSVSNDTVAIKGDASPVEFAKGVTAWVGLVDDAAGVEPEADTTVEVVALSAKEAGQALASKSISSLGDLASAIRQLMWILEDKEWETEWSGKESAGLTSLRALGPSLIEAFNALAVEEVNAFAAYITDATTDATETVTDAINDVATDAVVLVTETAAPVVEVPAAPVAEPVTDAPAVKDDTSAADLANGGLVNPEVLTPVVDVPPLWAAPFADMAKAIAAMAVNISTLSEGIAASKATSDEAVAKAEKIAEEAVKRASDAETAASGPFPRSVGIEETTPVTTGVSVKKAVTYDPELIKAFDRVLPSRVR